MAHQKTFSDKREWVKQHVSVSEVVREYVDLKPKGQEQLGLCPFHSEKTPSFTVRDDKGFFHCFGCGASGDSISFIKQIQGVDFKQAVEYIAGRFGYGDPVAKKRAKVKAPPTKEQVARQKNNAIEWSRKIWDGAGIADHSAVERYLNGRGIDVAHIGGMPKSLRAGMTEHKESGLNLITMIGAMKNESRGFCGIHRTFLRSVSANNHARVARIHGAALGCEPPNQVVIKTEQKPDKKMNGLLVGASIRFAEAGHRLAIAEGIETALSIMIADDIPCWAALSLSNMATIELPERVREVVLCVDNDMKDDAMAERMIRKATNAHRKAGREVLLAKPDSGNDFNDMLQEFYFGRSSLA